jgi:hypothetical protein
MKIINAEKIIFIFLVNSCILIPIGILHIKCDFYYNLFDDYKLDLMYNTYIKGYIIFCLIIRIH